MKTARKSAHTTLDKLDVEIVRVRHTILDRLKADAELCEIQAAVSAAVGQRLADDEFADQYATTLVSIVVALRMNGLSDRQCDWIACSQRTIWRPIFFEALALAKSGAVTAATVPTSDEFSISNDSGDYQGLYFYEALLARRNRSQRMRRGVYFTPSAVARFIVRSIDQTLRSGAGFGNGLFGLGQASESTPGCPLRVLDPACGTGVFLLAVIEWLHAHRAEHGLQDRADWSDFIRWRVLPNLVGFEILMPAAAIARVALCCKLLATGLEAEGDLSLGIHLVNTLAPPDDGRSRWTNVYRTDVESVESERLETPLTVVLGNPPFRGLSENHNPWIGSLLKGGCPGESLPDYYATTEGPISEKKVWLQDDYVKFFRYAQWRLRDAETAAIGFITNHAYLDSATFRGMRSQLLRAFPNVNIVDLHGSVKKREATGRSGEQNIFNIEQGVAVGLFSRPQSKPPTYSDLWGSREEKLRRLADTAVAELPAVKLPVAAPYYLFVPRDDGADAEYEKGWPLPEVMPEFTTAAVTARDRFVMDHDRARLLGRLERFTDERVSDDEIRAQFFRNSRSTRYPAGDTRGWKLAEAREQLRRDDSWRRKIQTCSFRPFDGRWILWMPEMVDWPREAVMSHLSSGENLALVTRRQMVPGQPCNFFFVSNRIVIDGLIRSDNRGTESFFPLWLGAARAVGSCNFNSDFLAALRDRAQCSGQLQASFAGQAFSYIYGLFQCSTYRTRFCDLLTLDFPRVFLPRTPAIFDFVARLGERLIGKHLGPDMPAVSRPNKQLLFGKRFPDWRDGQLLLSEDVRLPVAATSWEYRIGSYQVIPKWLKERRRDGLSDADLAYLRNMIDCISAANQLIAQLDEFVEQSGGWSACFG